MRVLLVDDEPLEHEGLKLMLKGLDLPLDVVAEAYNGTQALQYAFSEKPDIVITDVRMPEMSGMEFVRLMRTQLPDCFVLFISGYEDFQAACDAIQLGASAWLVKPVNREELHKVLDSVCRLRQQLSFKQQEQVVREHRLRAALPLEQSEFLRALLIGGCGPDLVHTRARELEVSLYPGQYAVVAADIHGHDHPFLIKPESLKCQSESLGPVFMPSGTLASILIYPANMNASTLQSKLETVSEAWRQLLLKAGCSQATVGVSLSSASAEQLHALYLQAESALRDQVNYGADRVIFYWESERKPPVDQLKSLDLAQWRAVLAQGDLDAVHEWASCFAQELSRCHHLESARKFAVRLLHTAALAAAKTPQWQHIAQTLEEDISSLSVAHTLPELTCTLESVIAGWQTKYAALKADRNRQVAWQVTEIVHAGLAGDLSSEAIAAKVFLTAAHVRRVFRNVMGITIQDYVLNRRMELAKELLRDIRYKVGVVAQKTGYESVSYFCLVFKRHIGMTPGELRSQWNLPHRDEDTP